jgi:arylsulfatase A-like enzyme
LPKRLGLLPLVLLSGACGEADSPTGSSRPRPSRPNIVFVLADDLDSDLLRFAPRIEELIGREGRSFRNAFVSLPLCAPSRASILTGQYAHNTGIAQNLSYRRFRRNGYENANVAVWLRNAGYRTGLVGKYLNDYPGGDPDLDQRYVPPGWDAWVGLLTDRPAGVHDYSINLDGEVHFFGRDPSEYRTDVMATFAEEFVRRSEASDAQPFFLFLAASHPHLPATPPPRYEASYPGVVAPRAPSFNEPDMSDKPTWLRAQPPLTTADVERLDRRFRRRAQSMLALSDMVERVMRALERHGELEDTYLFFSSDNGHMMGQHRFPENKDAAYDESIRVPLLVRGPGIAPGTTSDHMTVNVDFAPTFLEIAGQPVPDALDGRSLMPLFGAAPPAESAWRQQVLLEHGSSGGVPAYVGLRTKHHLYVEYDLGEVGEPELYDLRSDPFQVEALDPRAHPELVGPLSARLAVLAECRGVACRQ